MAAAGKPVRLAAAGDAAEWDAYVAAHPEASHYHRYGWRRLIKQAFGHTGYYFMAHDGAGAVAGILPAIRLKSRLFGDYLVSMPYFNYGGVLAEGPATGRALLDAAAQLANELGLTHFEARSLRAWQPAWPKRTDKVCMHLELPRTEAELFKSLRTKLRAQIKRPLREGAQALEGDGALLDDFYSVFARNMRDLGTPVYARRFFEQMLAAWPDETRIVSIRLGTRPVAAAFLLGWRSRLEIPWASSLREYNRIGVNMMLYAEVLKFAIRNRFELFDFGRSSIDAGTYRFKKQWGARPVSLCWEYWVPEGRPLPELRPDAAKFRLAVAAWQKLPLAIANGLGPHIVKYLP